MSKAIFLSIDDIGIAGVGAYAAQIQIERPPLTPTMDALATAGVRYTNCRVNPVCGATRVEWLTGQAAWRTGIGTNVFSSSLLPNGTESWIPAQDSRPWGLIGKFHLGHAGNGFDPTGYMGFDRYVGPLANLVGNSVLGSGSMGFYYWDRFDSASTKTALIGERDEDGFVIENPDNYNPTVLVDDAIDWVQGESGDWVLYLAMNTVHDPLHLPPAALLSAGSQVIRQHIIDAQDNDDPNAGISALSLFNQYSGLGLRNENEYRWELIRLGMEALDTEIARLISTLEGSGDINFATDTTIWITGDNGPDFEVVVPPELGQNSKGTVYDTGTLVPLIVRGADVSDTGVCDGLVNATDLCAAIATLDGETLTGAEDANDFTATLADVSASTGRTVSLSEQWSPEGVPIFTEDGFQSAGFTFLRRGLTGDYGSDGLWKLIRFYDERDGTIRRSELYRLDVGQFERPKENLLRAGVTETFESCAGDCDAYTALRRLQREFDAITPTT